MSMSKEDLMNEAFDAGLITLGTVCVGFASKKILEDGLGAPSTPMSIAKLAVAIAGGSILVQYLQKKDLLPNDPVKKKTTST